MFELFWWFSSNFSYQKCFEIDEKGIQISNQFRERFLIDFLMIFGTFLGSKNHQKIKKMSSEGILRSSFVSDTHFWSIWSDFWVQNGVRISKNEPTLLKNEALREVLRRISWSRSMLARSLSKNLPWWLGRRAADQQRDRETERQREQT